MVKTALFIAGCAFISGTVRAEVTDVWQCNVKTFTTVKVNGKTTKGTDYGSSTSVLHSDGTYTSNTPVSPITTHGTYTIKGRKITFYPNQNDLVSVAETACATNGNTCMVTAIQVNSLKGTLSKDFSKFNGVGVLKMSMLFNGSILARATSKGVSACYKQQ